MHQNCVCFLVTSSIKLKNKKLDFFSSMAELKPNAIGCILSGDIIMERIYFFCSKLLQTTGVGWKKPI